MSKGGGKMVKATETVALAQAQLVHNARRYAQAAKSDATRAAYRSDWRGFVAWCEGHGLDALPATGETVALYVTHLADELGRKVSSIERALASISQAHKVEGQESPRGTAPVRAVMQGIKRTHGTAPAQKAPVLVDDLRAMVVGLSPDTLIGQRDRALLLLGFAGAFRRAELVALDVADVAFTRDGIEVTVRRSKTDAEGAGEKVGVPYGSDGVTCPVRALQTWLKTAERAEGALFIGLTRHGRLTGKRLSGRDAARVVQRSAKAAGLNPKFYGGHSLRAGLATAAAKAGKSERVIMAQGRWRSVTMARRYIRDGNLFADNAAAGIGL